MKYIIFIIAVSILLTGCYNRTTTNYEKFKEIGSLDEEAFERTTLTKEEEKERQKLLEEIAKQPYPEYKIDSGDVISIKIYNHPELNTDTLVAPDGNIGMMFVNQIKLSGLTISEAVEVIQNKLSAYIKDPVVSVQPIKIASQNVTIAGGVENPGIYEVYSGMRLSDLYARAGGSGTRYFDGQVMEAADLRFSAFFRNGKIIPIDFIAAIEKSKNLDNIKIQKGDYVFVAVRMETVVTLLGDVESPHQRIWTSNLTLLELIAAGGGLKESYWPYAIIIRGGFAKPSYYKINIDKILHGKRRNIRIEAGDIIYIPRDDISEFNIFVRKLMPMGELINLYTTPAAYYLGG